MSDTKSDSDKSEVLSAREIVSDDLEADSSAPETPDEPTGTPSKQEDKRVLSAREIVSDLLDEDDNGK